MGPDFFKLPGNATTENILVLYFLIFLWTLRSIYLPMFWVLKMNIPKADLYHCVATGYAGVLGSMAVHFHDSSLLISEHGIYTREREEELIKAEWVKGAYKNIWIEQFKKMSLLAYEKADIVTCLYARARLLQMELSWLKPYILAFIAALFSLLFRIRLRRGRDIRALKGIPRRANKAKVGS